MARLTATQLPPPKAAGDPAGVSPEAVLVGQPTPAIDRIKHFSDEQWEDFILEWVDSLRDQYGRVERCGGAGDMGRDIIAIVKDDGNGAWDNYQCKHYSASLQPTDIWIELGKLAYYTMTGEYTFPRRYYFVAPRGAGTKLSNLFKKPDKLRAEFIANWHGYCRTQITSTKVLECDDAMLAHINAMDFSIFEATPPLRIIEGHSKTRWHVARFGGGLPQRPPIARPPVELANSEATYVRELFRAYADHLKQSVNCIEDLSSSTDLQEHFGDSRLEFYSAESLRTFSRDTLPPGEFEKLQDDVHSGIKDEIRGVHADGYRRVIAVVKTARQLQLDSHALNVRTTVRDRGGICHQLANEQKARWVK